MSFDNQNLNDLNSISQDANIITELTPTQQAQPIQQDQTSKSQVSQLNLNKILRWSLVGLGIVLIAVSIIYLFVRSAANKAEKLNEKLESAQKESAILKARLDAVEDEKNNYIQHINHLSEELEAREELYNSNLPMQQNSYDAPDPDAQPENPVVKNKQAIRQMINSKRPTVQDAIDEQNQKETEKQEQLSKTAQDEIKDLTNDANHTEEEEEIEQLNRLSDVIAMTTSPNAQSNNSEENA